MKSYQGFTTTPAKKKSKPNIHKQILNVFFVHCKNIDIRDDKSEKVLFLCSATTLGISNYPCLFKACPSPTDLT